VERFKQRDGVVAVRSETRRITETRHPHWADRPDSSQLSPESTVPSFKCQPRLHRSESFPERLGNSAHARRRKRFGRASALSVNVHRGLVISGRFETGGYSSSPKRSTRSNTATNANLPLTNLLGDANWHCVRDARNAGTVDDANMMSRGPEPIAMIQWDSERSLVEVPDNEDVGVFTADIVVTVRGLQGCTAAHPVRVGNSTPRSAMVIVHIPW
jgi:hypothetical protein